MIYTYDSLPVTCDEYGTNIYSTTMESGLIDVYGEDVIVLTRCKLYRKLIGTQYVFTLFAQEPTGDYLKLIDGDPYTSKRIRFIFGGHVYEYMAPKDFEGYKQVIDVNVDEWMELMK